MRIVALPCLLIGLLAAAPVMAEEALPSCESLAVSKDGASLSGAARDSSISKCIGDRVEACKASAVSKTGKPLSGAALNASLEKCNSENGVRAYCESQAVSKSGKPLTGAAKTAVVKKCMSAFDEHLKSD